MTDRGRDRGHGRQTVEGAAIPAVLLRRMDHQRRGVQR
jgi:hypothetical protein